MTDEQKAAYVNAQAVAALIEAMGLVSENAISANKGEVIHHGKETFQELLDRYNLHHSNLITLFHT